ncbi:MAG: hypothetical protein ACRCUF_06990 [Aeromonas sobria]|jgi:hypothetical protein|uniref:hypothetical protein n=1 Tax=Aeromonas sobria TaxID=646 RepID=UPI00111BA6EA|nr:hypothetical protein CF111_04050 [Aeromonas sobria]
MLSAVLGKLGAILGGIGCALHHTIDGEQLQLCQAKVVGMLMPAGCSDVKYTGGTIVSMF